MVKPQLPITTVVTPERGRRRGERIPGELGVVVRVDVHDAGRQHEPAGVDALRGGAEVAPPSPGRDAAVLHRHAAARAGVPRPSMMSALSITRSCATSGVLLGSGRGLGARRAAPAAAAPLVEDGIGVERAQGGRRTSAVVRLARAISALMAETRSITAASVPKRPDLIERAVRPGADLEGQREDRELLALKELLDPPERIIRRLEAGDGPALALELVELACPLGVLDLLLDPGRPVLLGWFAALSWRPRFADDTRW